MLDAELKEQDINFAKETDLFKVYSEINDNLNQAVHPEIKFNSDSFYSVYLQRINEFEEIISFDDASSIGKEKISFFEFVGNLYPSVKKNTMI